MEYFAEQKEDAEEKEKLNGNSYIVTLLTL